MTDDHSFITKLPHGVGTRVAIKDLLDVRGVVTTAGCLEVARDASPATADAACLAGIRAAERAGAVAIVGKTNLHELAFGVTGINPSYGTPINPLDARRVPGGSSSGSAVAVATGGADIAIGTDTGGSIRIPAACCGVVGLKTTWGRIPLQGCRPLAPSLDTIGPLARDVAGATAGMDLLEPGFAATLDALAAPTRVARLRVPVDIDPAIDAAIDAALQASGLEIVELAFDAWPELQETCLTLLLAEAWEVDGSLLARPDSLVTEATKGRLLAGAEVAAEVAAAARAARAAAAAQFTSLLTDVDALVLPSAPIFAPTFDDAPTSPIAAFTRPVNFSGSPSLALPLPVPAAHRRAETAHLPASVQLIGRSMGEATLLRVGAVIEAAAAG